MKRSRVVRVWDRKKTLFGKRARPSNNANDSDSTAAGGQDAAVEIPHVLIHGVPYYSDRFYLNKAESDVSKDESSFSNSIPTSTTATTTTTTTTSPKSCTCGARQPPPLFDRSALVASLDLKAAIVGTFNLSSKAFLVREFPSLFGAQATVPTLVLHGRIGKDDKQQGLNDNEDSSSSQGSSLAHDDDDEEEESPVGGADWRRNDENKGPANDDDDDDDLSIGTQPESTIETAASFQFEAPPLFCDTTDLSSREETGGEGFSPHAHFTQVSPTWLPPPALTDVVRGRRKGIRSRQRKRGVYHPKFMLLLEKNSGDLIVVVSTANLTGSLSTDGSWIQRFPAAKQGTLPEAVNRHNNNDFGAVLQDFMAKQSQACDTGALTPCRFWKMHCNNGQSLRHGFDYSQAQADLIPHVPGDFPVDDVTNNDDDDDDKDEHPKGKSVERFLYGRQRVKHLLKQRAATLPRLSTEDRLLMQPTSLGADWDPHSLTKIIQSYLPSKKVDHEENLLSRIDIIWPTDDWIKEVASNSTSSPPSATTTTMEDKDEPSSEMVEISRAQQGFIFLSAQNFNQIHTDCLARMVQFQPTTQKEPPLAPHVKSVARLLHRRPPGVSEGFAWFLLTSACLSRGAQGAETIDPNTKEKVASFSNFELGVLFCSQRALPMSDKSLIYCYQPTQCSCQQRANHPNPTTKHRLVHLPLPYQCRASRYVDNPYDGESDDEEEVLHFSVTPYFHEILPGSATEKNMLLTPYGKAALQQQQD